MADITVQLNDIGLFLGESNPPAGDGPNTPALPVANLDLASIKSLVDKIKEIIELREGVRGSKFDQNITWRSLFQSGLTKVTLDGVSYSAETATPLGLITNTDYTTPPNVTNVTGSAGLAIALISWDLPNYSNFAYAEVWRSATDQIGTAVLIGTTTSIIYTDSIGATSITYYYWVRVVSQNNIIGPYNAINGVAVTTSTVNSTNIADAAITTAHIGLLAVDNARIANSTISGAKIANATITTANIGLLAVDNGRIANGAISSVKIEDAAIINTKIGVAAIKSANIEDSAIKSANIEDSAIINTKIQNAAISTSKIEYAAITEALIEDLAVSEGKIQTAAITTAKIRDANVEYLKIADQAVSITAFTSGTELTITVPTGGADVFITGFVSSVQTQASYTVKFIYIKQDSVQKSKSILNVSNVVSIGDGFGNVYTFVYYGSASVIYRTFLVDGTYTFTITSDAGISLSAITAQILRR